VDYDDHRDPAPGIEEGSQETSQLLINIMEKLEHFMKRDFKLLFPDDKLE